MMEKSEGEAKIAKERDRKSESVSVYGCVHVYIFSM